MSILEIINCIASCFAAIGTVGATIFALHSACGPHLKKLKFNFRPQYSSTGELECINIDLKNTDEKDIILYYIRIEAHNKYLEGSDLAHQGVLIDTAGMHTKKVDGFVSPVLAERSTGVTINANSILTLKVHQGTNGINLQDGHELKIMITDSRGKKKESYKLKVQDAPATKS